MYLLKLFLATVLISLIVTPLVRKLAFLIGAVDKPNHRKVHKTIMPRMGGLAVYLSFMIVILATQTITKPILGLLLGSTVIIGVGIVDDIKELTAKVKLIFQILAAIVLVLFGIRINVLTNPFNPGEVIQLGILSIPFTIFWIIGVTNAVNLIDGLDGLASGLSMIGAITLGLVAWSHEGQWLILVCTIVLAGSILGFLKYNFHPASIFLGDTGALFLGYTLSALSVLGLTKGATAISIFVPIVVLGVPILDTLFAIVRRYMNKQPIFQADKEHLHHRLLAIGFSHKQTVLIIYAMNTVLGASAILIANLKASYASIALVILFTFVVISADKVGVLRWKTVARISQKLTKETK